MSGMSTIWEDTYGSANQYRHPLYIYLVTVILPLYGMIMYREINKPGHGNNVVNGINSTDTSYLKGEMELLVKLASNNTSRIRMILSN